MNVEYARPAKNVLALILLVEEGHILNLIFAFQQLIEKVYQEVFVHLLTENHLETDVGERVNILGHDSVLMQFGKYSHLTHNMIHSKKPQPHQMGPRPYHAVKRIGCSSLLGRGVPARVTALLNATTSLESEITVLRVCKYLGRGLV